MGNRESLTVPLTQVPENAETDADAAKIIEEKRRAMNPVSTVGVR